MCIYIYKTWLRTRSLFFVLCHGLSCWCCVVHSEGWWGEGARGKERKNANVIICERSCCCHCKKKSPSSVCLSTEAGAPRGLHDDTREITKERPSSVSPRQTEAGALHGLCDDAHTRDITAPIISNKTILIEHYPTGLQGYTCEQGFFRRKHAICACMRSPTHACTCAVSPQTFLGAFSCSGRKVGKRKISRTLCSKNPSSTRTHTTSACMRSLTNACTRADTPFLGGIFVARLGNTGGAKFRKGKSSRARNPAEPALLCKIHLVGKLPEF